ncbi:transketolase family protein [Fonticella tunisiensis]|uniref:Transketolase subunit B n=1 Tax=Fonticella tunisiensis TaxID=1096341 RepID=A0A4V3ETL9_9CLOT|nr:transketolase C-terminal domain-containing protein [Fonticella tunisiensis]TDT61027.1 transketolase subunit B [Fonticella tunisiensis]
MRSTFINTLTKMARQDKELYLITGDLGFSVFEGFQKEFGERFINAGISEANMIGTAAGLAMVGKRVFVYSIIPFLTMRCFEQIRNDLCYQNLNVCLVGVGGGLSYGSSGATHHAIEDISIMRSLPNMKVICPGDPFEVQRAVEQVISLSGPSYIRLSKNGEPRLHSDDADFKIGKAIKMMEGRDISIIATGNMLEEAIEVSRELIGIGYGVKLISMHTIKPIDEQIIKECIHETRAIFTIEEHSIIGGLGGAVSEVVAGNITKPFIFKPFGIPDVYADSAGSSSYFRKKYGINRDGVLKSIIETMKSV